MRTEEKMMGRAGSRYSECVIRELCNLSLAPYAIRHSPCTLYLVPCTLYLVLCALRFEL
jgi:hypothetical protein